MIPLVGFDKEFQLQRDIVDRVAKEVLGAAGLTDQKYLIGTMIEIVRGAMTADEIARDAEFFSFGTNGRVIKEAIRLGRQTRPDLEIGICGEHGGDPESVAFCYHVGMDYVSCSPYRVPIARLAAAQAAISGSDKIRIDALRVGRTTM